MFLVVKVSLKPYPKLHSIRLSKTDRTGWNTDYIWISIPLRRLEKMGVIEKLFEKIEKIKEILKSNATDKLEQIQKVVDAE